eukprot:Amastigsp_a508696_247.p1 type:complete len:370 gc:universal Amastigsp_a508696_247:1180-71(-)
MVAATVARLATIFAISGLLLAVLPAPAFAAYGCLGYDKKPVDWWSMVKFPVVADSRNKLAASGYGFMYLDSTGSELEVSTTNINDTNAPLAATLLQMYENYNAETTAWVLFNDQWPNGNWTLDYAHQKGLGFFDATGGFYLIHSVPHYPEYLKNGYYGYPSYEIPNGQSFLCLSLAYSQFSYIGDLLMRSGPWIYDSNIPASFVGLDSLRSVIAGDFITEPGTSTITLNTTGGAAFVGLYKNKEWDKDLYEDFVAPTLHDGMLVQSWMQGGAPLPTYCTPKYPYDVINIRSMSVQDTTGYWIEWSEVIDHSKWGVTISNGYTCIGGINRMYSQRVRGGGTVCHYDPAMWKPWNALIHTSDHCKDAKTRG